EIARDLGEADQLFARIAKRGDHDVDEETRAVLAHAPPFLLEAAVGRGDLQLALALATVSFGLRIKPREVLADDLVGAVALDALGAGVPGDHPARGIEHEDGVVPDAVHHQAEALVTQPEGLRRALLG